MQRAHQSLELYSYIVEMCSEANRLVSHSVEMCYTDQTPPLSQIMTFNAFSVKAHYSANARSLSGLFRTLFFMYTQFSPGVIRSRAYQYLNLKDILGVDRKFLLPILNRGMHW